MSHPLQLTTGLVINSSVTTSPTLAGESMLLIPKVSILSGQIHYPIGTFGESLCMFICGHNNLRTALRILRKLGFPIPKWNISDDFDG